VVTGSVKTTTLPDGTVVVVEWPTMEWNSDVESVSDE